MLQRLFEIETYRMMALLFVLVFIVTRRVRRGLTRDERHHQLPDSPEHL